MHYIFKNILCIFSVFLYDLKSNDSDFELYINNNEDRITFFLYIKQRMLSKKDTLKEFISNNKSNLKKEFYNKIKNMNEKKILGLVEISNEELFFSKDGYYKYEFLAILDPKFIKKEKYQDRLFECLIKQIKTRWTWALLDKNIKIDKEDSEFIDNKKSIVVPNLNNIVDHDEKSNTTHSKNNNNNNNNENNFFPKIKAQNSKEKIKEYVNRASSFFYSHLNNNNNNYNLQDTIKNIF